MRWIALIMFGGVGFFALAGGLWWTVKRYRLISSGQVAQGKVSGQRESTTTESGEGRLHIETTQTSYFPIVEFQTAKGETVRFEGSTGGLGKPEIETGTAVQIVYDPAHPTEAVITDYSQLWLGPLVVSVAGIIFLGLGFGAFALMGSSDRALEAAGRQAALDRLVFRQDAVHIQATIDRVKRLEGNGPAKYVLVCKGLRPGASVEEEFQTEFFPFEPDGSFVGRTVEVILDPVDVKAYLVELGPLLKEIVRLQRK